MDFWLGHSHRPHTHIHTAKKTNRLQGSDFVQTEHVLSLIDRHFHSVRRRGGSEKLSETVTFGLWRIENPLADRTLCWALRLGVSRTLTLDCTDSLCFCWSLGRVKWLIPPMNCLPVPCLLKSSGLSACRIKTGSSIQLFYPTSALVLQSWIPNIHSLSQYMSGN